MTTPPEATDEQVRGFALEQAVKCREPTDAIAETLAAAKMFEGYLKTGELLDPAIQAIYEEGANEARFEVKEAVEAHFSIVDLDDLFRLKNWSSTDEER